MAPLTFQFPHTRETSRRGEHGILVLFQFPHTRETSEYDFNNLLEMFSIPAHTGNISPFPPSPSKNAFNSRTQGKHNPQPYLRCSPGISIPAHTGNIPEDRRPVRHRNFNSRTHGKHLVMLQSDDMQCFNSRTHGKHCTAQNTWPSRSFQFPHTRET